MSTTTELLHSAIDPVSWAIRTIDHSHYEIHEGDSYLLYHKATIGSAEVSGIAITTGDSAYPHIILQVSSTGAATYRMLRDVTSFSGGVAKVPSNRNFVTSNISEVTALVGNTGASPITPTGGALVDEGSVASIIGGESRGTQEFILEENTNYYFEIISGAATNVTTLKIDWYENGCSG